jgi:hypothetical protein
MSIQFNSRGEELHKRARHTTPEDDVCASDCEGCEYLRKERDAWKEMAKAEAEYDKYPDSHAAKARWKQASAEIADLERPEAPKAETCPECGGLGYGPQYTGRGLEMGLPNCPACHGTGRKSH